MSKIIGLVTLYNPTLENVRGLSTIFRQTDRVYLCDNSPYDNHELFSGLENVIYIKFERNLGLSGAYNEILKSQLGWNDDDYIIFFDQDSCINERHIQSLIEEYEAIMALGGNVACIGPAYFDANSGKIETPKIRRHISKESYEVKNVITSSMLTTYRMLREVNCWNDNIFLDYADFELCWRWQKKGYECYMTEKVTLQHQVGIGRKTFLFFSVRVCTPIREYYQIRDALYLMGEDYVPVRMRIRLLIKIFVHPFIHLIVMDSKRERLKFILSGIKDFFMKKNGEYLEKR